MFSVMRNKGALLGALLHIIGLGTTDLLFYYFCMHIILYQTIFYCSFYFALSSVVLVLSMQYTLLAFSLLTFLTCNISISPTALR